MFTMRRNLISLGQAERWDRERRRQQTGKEVERQIGSKEDMQKSTAADEKYRW
jgi:Spy/CpxP family protein refolding chaperone